jgi:hypothetical protein
MGRHRFATAADVARRLDLERPALPRFRLGG